MSKAECDAKQGMLSDRVIDNSKYLLQAKLRMRGSQINFFQAAKNDPPGRRIARPESSSCSSSPAPPPAPKHFKFETPRTNLQNYSALQQKIK